MLVPVNPFAPPRLEDPVFGRSRALAPKLCPCCGANVSFGRVYFALGPHHVRCGACRTRLGYDDLQGPGLVLLLGLGAMGGAAWWGYSRISLDPLEVVLVLLAGCVVLSVPLTGYVWARQPLCARTVGAASSR